VAARDLTARELQDVVRILREAGVVYALVFGSAARGELRADSDLDLAVAGAKPLTSEERRKLVERLAAAARRPIDLIDLRTARGLVYAKALQGKELFCESVRAKGEAFSRRVGLIAEDLDLAQRSFAMARPRMFR
jgi:predicted nucleotidyltransferase